MIKFVEEKEGLGFAEAVELLADRYGVELEREREDPRAEARRQQRRRLGELLDRTAAFYASYLWESEEAGKAREYLAERGLGEEVLRAFGVGYAPSAWDKVLVRGQRAGFRVDGAARRSGWCRRGEGEASTTASARGSCSRSATAAAARLGFGGRAMRSDQGAKYVNTAETDFFHKSQMLYGIDLAKAAIAKAGRAVVVEGYTDVLALHQAGVRGGGRGDGDGDHRGAGGGALGDGRGGGAGARRRLRRPGGDAAGAAGRSRAQHAAAGGGDAGRRGPGRDDGRGGRGRALPRPGRGGGRAAGLPGRAGAGSDRYVGSPAERDRALAEVAPILAGMGETASRDDLVRRVAERLDLEPAMVMGRW